MEEQTRYERIDGTDYQVGTADHRMASAAREARQDALYLERNGELREMWERRIRNWDSLYDRLHDLPARRADANAVAFLARELVFVRSTVERVLYEKLFMAEYCQIEGGHDRGAQIYENQIWDEAGEARITRQLSGESPRVDVSKSSEQRPYVWADAAYGWSDEELYAAAFAGTPLLREKARACAQAIARKLDKIGRSGSIINNIRGFLNSLEVPLLTQTNGEHTSTGTAAEILADFAEWESAIFAASGDNTPPEYAALVPTLADGRYRTLDKSSGSDLSVLNYFLTNSRLIKRVRRYGVLDSAVTPDVAASDAPMAMIYPVQPGTFKALPDVVIWPFSVQYEETAPKPNGNEMIVTGKARCSGPDFRHPKMCLYIQNMD